MLMKFTMKTVIITKQSAQIIAMPFGPLLTLPTIHQEMEQLLQMCAYIPFRELMLGVFHGFRIPLQMFQHIM